tara:strand:+ start:101 stop:838 length:738 start_codon:yes stop_codon:yes gene_type:complete
MSSSPDSGLFRLLAMGDLLDPLSRIQAELRFVTEYKLSKDKLSITDDDAILGLMKELNINDREILMNWQKTHLLSTELASLIEYARYRFKRRCIIDDLISGNGEALFLRYKDRLDRVLYSLIRVDSEDFAFHLYYQIEADELTFGEAARLYSNGAESKTEGIIGPCDLTVPHPDIASRLRSANPKQLFQPFNIDQWFAIIRLEYRFDSEYNEATREFLGKLLLSTKTKSIYSEIFSTSISSFLDK